MDLNEVRISLKFMGSLFQHEVGFVLRNALIYYLTNNCFYLKSCTFWGQDDMGLYDLQSRCCQLPTVTINMSQQSFLVTKWTDLFPGVNKLNQLHLKDICQKIMISSFEWLIIMLFFPVIENRTNSLLRPLWVLYDQIKWSMKKKFPPYSWLSKWQSFTNIHIFNLRIKNKEGYTMQI